MAGLILAFSNANPVRMVVTERNTSGFLFPLQRDFKFFKQYSLPGFDSFFQPFLNTDILTVQWDDDWTLATHTIYLRNYYTDAIIFTSTTPTEIDDRTTYKVFEQAITITGLDGLYYIEVKGSELGHVFTATSEPLHISGSHCDTVMIAYNNDDNAFGIDYENSTVEFNLRIPAFFSRTADEAETELFKDSGGNTSIVSSQGTRVRVLKANQLIPQWIIEKVNLALLHDNVEIDELAVSADQQWPYDVISDKKLWAEPEVNIILASGSSGYINAHEL